MKIFIAVLVLTVFVVPFAFGEVYSNMVGLYKIDVTNGRNLVSMPFLPFSASLDDVIGDQLTGHIFNRAFSDNIEAWDSVNKVYKRAWYNTTAAEWRDWDGGAPTFGFDPDGSYWINIVLTNPDKTIALLGEVSETAREIEVGMDRNLVAPSFPTEIALGDSGLVDSGFVGHLFNAAFSDRIEWYDKPTSSYMLVWYKTEGAGTWMNWNGTPSTKTIVPGEGFWVVVTDLPGHAAFTWTVPKPY